MDPATESPGSLTKADYEALANFRYSLRRFLHFSEEAATRHAVTPQQYQALLAIEGFPGELPITVGELAEQLFIEHHSASGLARRLEVLGLVVRKRCSTDRRRVRLLLTQQGRGILERLYRIHQEELRMLGPNLQHLITSISGCKGSPASR